MLPVLIIMFVGMLIGYFIRERNRLIKMVDKMILFAIILLLFLLGVIMGNNDQIMSNLTTIGLHAVYISVASILGSIMLAYFVGKIFFTK